MNLEKAIDYAAEHLHNGWTIHISVENGAGWVRAERPDGSIVEMHKDETTFGEQVLGVVRLSEDEMKSGVGARGIGEQYEQT